MDHDDSNQCPVPHCSFQLKQLMNRTEVVERILFGRAEDSKPGLIERHNNTERIASGIQRRLDQVLTAVVGMLIAGVMNLVLINRSTNKIEEAVERAPAAYHDKHPAKTDETP